MTTLTPPAFTTPLTFAPYLRPQVWGGRRLATLLNKPLPSAGAFGESWELCPLPQALSRVANGPHAGLSIDDLWQMGLAKQVGLPSDGGFPWLIKWLDIQDWLSVQVHPDAERAQKWLGAPCAKSEAWVVVHAEAMARVYAGFHEGVTPADVRKAMEHGRLVECLHSFTPQVGDCINFPAGTVHAAGGGLVLAEVQQPSDATFRLFDWNRLGTDGRPRELHIEAGLDCIAWPQGPVKPQPRSSLPANRQAVRDTRLLATPYFEFDLIDGVGSWPCRDESLAVWMVLSGAAELKGADGARALSRGATVLIPPDVDDFTWTIREPAQLLRIRYPRS